MTLGHFPGVLVLFEWCFPNSNQVFFVPNETMSNVLSQDKTEREESSHISVVCKNMNCQHFSSDWVPVNSAHHFLHVNI